MAARWKPVLNQLRRILRPTGNLLCDLIAKGQLLVNSEASSVKQCELVLRLIDCHIADLQRTRAEIVALLAQQHAELHAANVIREGKIALSTKVTEAEALAAAEAA